MAAGRRRREPARRPGRTPGAGLCAAGRQRHGRGRHGPGRRAGPMVRQARGRRRQARRGGLRHAGAGLGAIGAAALRPAGAGQPLRAAGLLARYPRRDAQAGAGRDRGAGRRAAQARRAGRTQSGAAGPAGAGIRAVRRAGAAPAARRADLRLCLRLRPGGVGQRRRDLARRGAGLGAAGRLRPPVRRGRRPATICTAIRRKSRPKP